MKYLVKIHEKRHNKFSTSYVNVSGCVMVRYADDICNSSVKNKRRFKKKCLHIVITLLIRTWNNIYHHEKFMITPLNRGFDFLGIQYKRVYQTSPRTKSYSPDPSKDKGLKGSRQKSKQHSIKYGRDNIGKDNITIPTTNNNCHSQLLETKCIQSNIQ